VRGVPLAAVLVPRVEEARRELSIEDLPLRAAIVEAIRHPRIGGFVDGRHLIDHLTVSSRLVEEVPFFTLRRPTSPGPPSVVVELVRRLRTT
jgi:hypothetical protein